MNTSGEVADLMVKEGIQITESAAKLAGLGAKNLAAIIVALLKDESRMHGKTNLKQLLKSDKPLCILQIKEAYLRKFNSEAKKYGVLFTAVSDKTNNTGLCDVIAKQEDVTKLNYIMEKLGYTAPAAEEKNFDDRSDAELQHDNTSADRSKEQHEKNSNPRGREYRSEHRYTKRGDTERADRNTKDSVRDRINDIKAQRADGKALGQTRSKVRKKGRRKGVSR